MEKFLLVVILVLIAVIIYLTKFKCKHVWELVEEGDRFIRGNRKGVYKVYECSRCKKMREEFPNKFGQ